jgi:hypothetical protein
MTKVVKIPGDQIRALVASNILKPPLTVHTFLGVLQVVHTDLIEHAGLFTVPTICRPAEAVALIAAYGGQENTQLASAAYSVAGTLNFDEELVSLLTNPKVGSMVNELLFEPKDAGDWATQICDKARTRCQGITSMLLSTAICSLHGIYRAMPEPRSEPWHAFWDGFKVGELPALRFYADLMAAFLDNKEITSDRKYPEFRTDKAVAELADLVKKLQDPNC